MRDYRERNPSPQTDKRGCLCPDGTYSRKCCDGSFQAQGIGTIIIGEEDSAGTIVQIDTTDTTSSQSTALPSQSSSTVTSVDTTSTSSTTTNDDYYDTSQGSSTIVNIDTTNTNVTVSGGEEEPTPATISSLEITSGTYETGDTLPLVATYTDTVTVDTTGGTPSIDVDLNSNTRAFTYSSGSGTNALTFGYTLAEADVDITSATAASTIDLNGGTITDSNGLDTSGTITTTSLPIEEVTLPTAPAGTPSPIEEIVDGSTNTYLTTGYQVTSNPASAVYFSGATSGYEIFDIQNLSDITDEVGEVMYRFVSYFPVYIMSGTIQVGAEVRPKNRSLDDPLFDSAFDGIDWTIPKYWSIYTSSEYLTFGYNNGTDTVVYVKRIIRVQENVNGKLIVTAVYTNEDAEGDQWIIS
jgi:hypothetical protein